MAEMIPEYAVHASAAAEALYQNLSRMLRSGYKVVQYLHSRQNHINPSNQSDHFSLFWIQKSQQSLFVYVSHGNISHSNVSHTNKANPGIDKNNKDTLAADINKNTEIRNILKFQQSLLPAGLLSHKARLVPFLAFFPQADDQQIKLGIKSHGLFLAGRQSMQGKELLTLLRTRIGIVATPFVIKRLQMVFSPELIMKPHTSWTSGNEDRKLFDEHQEIAIKSELYLPVDARRSNNYNLRVLNGVAGSGKTQVVIHRANLIRTLFPAKKVLILCHNQAIKQCIESRYQALNPGDRKIKINSFSEWSRKNFNAKQKLVIEETQTKILEIAFQRHLKDTGLTTDQFVAEINHVNKQLIFNEADYLASHAAQTKYKNKELLRKLWLAMAMVKNELKRQHRMLWSELPKQLLQSVNEGRLLEHYDHILIDEAQYFTPVQFELIKKSLKQHSGQLYLAFDENQSFLKSRLHLQDTGLDLREHSIQLQSSYRLNPAIMRAAHAVYHNQLPDLTDDIIARCGIGKYKEIKPRVLHFSSRQNEQARLFKEIHDLLNPANQPRVAEKDILILTTKPQDAEPLASSIKQNLKLTVDLATFAQNHSNALRVCPLESATGLESHIVFITGVQDLFSSAKTTEEPTMELIENTRKLYMGMTRATQKLNLMLTAETIPDALFSETIDIPTLTNKHKRQTASINYLQSAG